MADLITPTITSHRTCSMGFRWPVGGIRAWIHQPTRKFHCSLKLQSSDNPSIPLTFNPILFPQFQNTVDPLPSSVQRYGLDIEDPNLKTYAFRLKWEMLLDSLSRDHPNPNRVWGAYCDVGSLVGFEKIPLQIHQQTLRKAVPPAERLGSIIAKRFQAAHRPSAPHLYENRLQTIIRNIRESGYQPALDDYHFILAQFASVAYFDGCEQVFHELVHRQRLEPTYKTYGLCLQAIAHRLTLPCPYRYRQGLLEHSNKMCFDLLDDMCNRGVSLTSVNFDLTHRVFKATQNWTLYEHLLKLGYGIDLTNPDRPALEIQNTSKLALEFPSSEKSVEMPMPSSSREREFKPVPFNIAALNTLIDALGTRGEISRMVIAFEVLTNPLPKATSSDVAWPDDDEDEFFNQSDTAWSYGYPSVAPNTTTFIFLIRHMAKAKEHVFARHYLKLASEIDRAERSRLRNELMSKPLGELTAPRLTITRAMVLPLHGLGNRFRHRPTLRWAYWMTRQVIHDKQEDLRFFTKWRDDHGPSDEVSLSRGLPEMPAQDVATAPDQPAAASQRFNVPQLLRINFDNPEEEKKTPGVVVTMECLRRPFQIDLYVRLLQRDIEQLQELCERTRDALKRSTHRLKEKLGRRVWNNKDIFLADKERRVHVNRREWMDKVGFGSDGIGKGMGNSNPIRDIPRWMEDDEEETITTNKPNAIA